MTNTHLAIYLHPRRGWAWIVYDGPDPRTSGCAPTLAAACEAAQREMEKAAGAAASPVAMAERQ